MTKFDRITVDPARMNGEPCCTLRLTVRRVLEALATYSDREELKREYPELRGRRHPPGPGLRRRIP